MYEWSCDGLILTENPSSTRWKPCPSVSLSTINLTWTRWEPNPCLRVERPVTNAWATARTYFNLDISFKRLKQQAVGLSL